MDIFSFLFEVFWLFLVEGTSFMFSIFTAGAPCCFVGNEGAFSSMPSSIPLYSITFSFAGEGTTGADPQLIVVNGWVVDVGSSFQFPASQLGDGYLDMSRSKDLVEKWMAYEKSRYGGTFGKVLPKATFDKTWGEIFMDNLIYWQFLLVLLGGYYGYTLYYKEIPPGDPRFPVRNWSSNI